MAAPFDWAITHEPFDWAITHDALLHPKIYLTSMIALGCWCMKDLW